MKITTKQLRQIIREEIKKTEINEQQRINEDWQAVGDIALGVAGGIALLNAGAFLKGFVRGVGQSLADNAKKAAYNAAKKTHNKIISSIADKFKDDSQLKSMFDSLPEYNEKEEKANVERRKQLTKIATYIKSKLTPDEMKYFKDVSSMLRGKSKEI